ncbi:hypothetical protein VTH82DRAFT_140, partial [Thermothelomyces myriococcoides]
MLQEIALHGTELIAGGVVLAIDQHPAGFHFQQTLLRLPRQAATTWKLGGWRSGLITRAVSDNQHDKGNNYQPQDPRQGQQAHPQRAVPRLHMHPQNTGGSISGLLPVEAAEYGAHDFLVSEEAGTQFHHTNPPWKDAPQARMTGNVAARAGRDTSTHASIRHARPVARQRSSHQSGRRYSRNDSPRTNPRITDSIVPSPGNNSSDISEESSRNAGDEAADDAIYRRRPEHVADRHASQASNPRLHLALQRPPPSAPTNHTATEQAGATPPSIVEAANRAAAALADASSQRSEPAAVTNSNLPPGVVRAMGPNTRNLGRRTSSGHGRKKKNKEGSLSVHLRWRPDGYVTLSEGSSTNTTPGMLTPLPGDNKPQHDPQQGQQGQQEQQLVLRLRPEERELSPPPPPPS